MDAEKLYRTFISKTQQRILLWENGSFPGEFCSYLETRIIRASFNVGYGSYLMVDELSIPLDKITFLYHHKLEKEIIQQLNKRRTISQQDTQTFLAEYLKGDQNA